MKFKILLAIYIIIAVFAFSVAAFHEKQLLKRPDLSYNVVYQDKSGVFLETVIFAESFYEAVAIGEKTHPELTIISVNRRSFVACYVIGQK